MPVTLTRSQAEATIKAVQDAHDAGHLNPIIIAAKALGLPRQTIKSRLADDGPCKRLYDLAVKWKEPPPAPDYAAYFAAAKDRPVEPETEQPKPETPTERLNRKLSDENRDLRKRLQEALRDANAQDAIREILGGIVARPVEPPDWLISIPTRARQSSEVPVTIWSDWHAGEVVSPDETNGVNDFNMEVMETRVRRLVERTIDLCKNHGPGMYPGVVINLLGDFVSGGLHPELLSNDELEVIPTTLRVRDVLVWALDEMIKAFGNVYCPCTSGNHGRHTHRPEFKRYVFKNFDWLIYQMLSRHYAGDDRIIFDIPETNEVRYRVYGQRYLAMHGDMLGTSGGDGIVGALGPLIRGETKIGKQSAALGLDYDVLLVGHWHQSFALTRLICASSLKGWDEYARLRLRAPPSPPSQPLWFVHPRWGRTAFREVFLEEPRLEANAPWVSFRPSKAA